MKIQDLFIEARMYMKIKGLGSNREPKTEVGFTANREDLFGAD
jgi:hypothetical protein